jgi:hypothetical protein
MNKSVFLKSENRLKQRTILTITFFNVLSTFFGAALNKLIFELHRDVLFHLYTCITIRSLDIIELLTLASDWSLIL